MLESLKRSVLAWLRVPPEPHPPAGDPTSLRVFRAGRNYLRLRLAGWAATQLLALVGIVFWTTMLFQVEETTRAKHAASQSTPPATTSTAVDQRTKPFGERFGDTIRSVATKAESASHSTRHGELRKGWAAYKTMLVEIALLFPSWAFPLVWVLKVLSLVIYVLQIPVTYAVRRLDYEMRWYMVTDRSLRLRHGVWNVSESTMSFANVQQVLVTQGPLQRLLGLSDVKVQSAGGGGEEPKKPGAEDMHLGLFHSVTNPTEIRELILERLRRFREAGLGDPDDKSSPASLSVDTTPASTLAAAEELLSETRALRAHLTGPDRGACPHPP